MRTGILTNSLPAGSRLYEELQDIPDSEFVILLVPGPNESPGKTLLKHIGRLLLKPGRLRSLAILASREVVVLRQPLDHPDSLARLEKLKLDVGLHQAGVIYRDPVIKAFRLGILNPHIGILPAYRGRNVMEWALLDGKPVGVTVFFIDTGIDTGERIVVSEEVDVSHCKSIAEAKQRLFDLDAVYFRRALELLRTENVQYGFNDGSGRRHYVMSRLFQGVVQNLLGANN